MGVSYAGIVPEHPRGVYESRLVAGYRYPPQAASWKPDEHGDAGLGSSAITVGTSPEATSVSLKTNRYDESTGQLQFIAAQAAAFGQEITHWADYFHAPSRNGGLKTDLITDPTELRQFTAFVTWAAWASVAARPGEAHSYTNNFPYDPSVGNVPISGALLWSAVSLMVLLAGIATVLLAFGKFDYLGWITRGHNVSPQLLPGRSSPGQNALVKFFGVVALLLLAQTLVGGATAHWQADRNRLASAGDEEADGTT